EAVREGVAEEGVELPAYVPSAQEVGPIGRAALTLEGVAALLGERFEGVTLALLPAGVSDERAFRGAVRVLDRMTWSPRLRVAVHAPPKGPLDGVLDPWGAPFLVDLAALLAFLKDLGGADAEQGESTPAPEDAARKLRALLLDAAARTEEGEHAAAVGQY